jgi:glycosyltransferase involved in cell wall biosynthesis
MKTVETIRFSIVVPTKNRADVLRHCLRTVVEQDYENLEVIVSDNYSADDTRTVVESFHDERIIYINTGGALSMKDNFEFALSHVGGGWVGFLGDDDGLMPGALKRVEEVVRLTGVRAVASSWCRYTWPSDRLMHADQLIVPVTRGVEVRNSSLWLDRVLSGVWRYIELPLMYTGGFIEHSIIKEAQKRNTRFFNSANVDVYSGIAIASILPAYAFIKNPIAIRGTSVHSTGASALGGSTNSQPKLDALKDSMDTVHPFLVRTGYLASMQLCIYESYLQSAFLRNESRARILSDMPTHLKRIMAFPAIEPRKEVLEYCRNVAEKNGISIRASVFDFKYRIKRLLYFVVEVERVLQSIRVNAAEAGVVDVYGAAVLAKTLVVLLPFIRFWRIKRIVLGVRDFLRGKMQRA